MKNSELKILLVGHTLGRADFANVAAEPVEVVCFDNEMNLAADGWAQLAPYGDFPGKGFRRLPDGKVEQFHAVQRMDRQAADGMVAQFHSPTARIKRYFKGCPIYAGHPNNPPETWKHNYPDKSPKGMIVDLQARDNGLYCKPVFANEAEPLLNQGTKLFFSGHWTSDELPKENGTRIFRPDQLKSAGLTPWPNLPVEYLNDRDQPQPPDHKMKTLLIPILAAFGFTFANDAEDQKLLDAVRGLGEKAKTADTLAQEKTAWANDKATLTQTVTARDTAITALTTERDTARTNFANERKARVTGLLDEATAAGRITAAERPDWDRRLSDETQFANESAAIGKLDKKLKTATVLQLGDRKVEIANTGQRSDTLRDLVNTEIKRSGCDYDTAYRAVAKANPALFEAMQQPKVN